MSSVVDQVVQSSSWVVRLERFLGSARLPVYVALVGVVLCAPSLWIGLHLDDLTHLHMLSSQLPMADALLAAYESPFGIANGEPSSIHWQIEQGLAPWWTVPDLLISLWRPVSTWTHRLDAALFFDAPVVMHLHSLLWWFAALWTAAQAYRGALGRTTLAGFAALLYALDHTHGFAVGWVANRNALVAVTFGLGTLALHYRAEHSRACRVGAPVCLAVALLAGEGSLAVTAFLAGQSLFVERGAFGRRVIRLLPYAAVVVLWRIVYQGVMGRGAQGSGLYIDPAREPVQFALAALERAPVLLLGSLGLPPAEAYVFAPPAQQPWVLAGAVALGALFLWVLWPLLRQDAQARAWAFGTACALIPACSTHPNNRLLFFVSFGVVGLLTQLFGGYVGHASWSQRPRIGARVAHLVAAALVGFRLLVSPLLLPVTACSIAVTSPVRAGLEAMVAREDLPGEELWVLHARDYYQVKLLPTAFVLAKRPRPARIRALSFGRGPVIARRLGPASLELEWPKGLLSDPLDTLYRDSSLPLPEGYTVELQGLTVRVTEVGEDGLVRRARFELDSPIDAPEKHWVRFDHGSWLDIQWQGAQQELRTEAKEPLVGL